MTDLDNPNNLHELNDVNTESCEQQNKWLETFRQAHAAEILNHVDPGPLEVDPPDIKNFMASHM